MVENTLGLTENNMDFFIVQTSKEYQEITYKMKKCAETPKARKFSSKNSVSKSRSSETPEVPKSRSSEVSKLLSLKVSKFQSPEAPESNALRHESDAKGRCFGFPPADRCRVVD